MKQKKASMSLSINAIVIIVLAFVMLGLGLALTTTIFNGAGSGLSRSIGLVDLGTKPTADNPIAIDNPLTLGNNKNTPIKIGIYNTDTGELRNVKLSFLKCVDAATGNEITVHKKDIVDPETSCQSKGGCLPDVNSIGQNIGSGDSAAYELTISTTDTKLTAGQYVCIIGAGPAADTTATPPIVAKPSVLTKQIQMKISS